MTFNDTLLNEWLQGPAFVPKGVIPNLDDPPSLHKYDALCQSFCLTIATLSVFMRLFTKKYVLRSLSWDDCK